MDDTRIILSGFWIALMLTYLLGDVLRIFAGDFEPGKIMGMQQSQWMYLLMAVIMLVPGLAAQELTAEQREHVEKAEYNLRYAAKYVAWMHNRYYVAQVKTYLDAAQKEIELLHKDTPDHPEVKRLVVQCAFQGYVSILRIPSPNKYIEEPANVNLVTVHSDSPLWGLWL